MTPQQGQHIKCFLRNGNVLEGIVETWSDTEIVLKTLDSQNLMIIHDPKQDIMLTKVLFDVQAPAPSRAQEIADKIKAKAAKEGQPEPDEPSLDVMTKAQLQVELAEQERRVVAEKLKDHYLDSQAPRKKTYGYPGFFKKSST
jgi:hypothetical protein